MDNRPIGFFDSGVGGLTSIPYVMRSFPEESIIFYGDTARTPYGSKSPDTIKEFTLQIGEFLIKKSVKMLVSACNTVSSTALDILREKYPDIPVVGTISPTAKEVTKHTEPGEHIGILATKATIESGAYENKIRELKPELKIFSKACPIWVPLIEEGMKDHPIMEMAVRYYLDDFIPNNEITSLVLGCTHYPLISGIIKKHYPDVKLFSSSKEVATAVGMELTSKDIKAEKKEGDSYFYASDLSDNFVDMIQTVLGRDKEELNIVFKNLDI